MLTKRNLNIIVPLLFAASYWGMMKIILPILPHFPAIFNTSSQSVHLMISLAYSLSGISGLAWGLVMDSFRPLKVVVVITALCVITLILASISKTLISFSIFFIACCSMMNLFSVYSRWYPTAVFTDKDDVKNALSKRHVGGYSAAFLFPFMAGWVAYHFDWRYIFIIVVVWVVIVLCYQCLITRGKSFRSTRTHESPIVSSNKFKIACSCLSNKIFLMNSLALCCVALVFQGYVISLPFWLTKMHKSPVNIIALYLLPIFIPGIIFPFFYKTITSRYSQSALARFCSALFVLSGVLYLILCSFSSVVSWAWVVPGSLITLCYTAVSPLLSYAAITTMPSHKGVAAGMLSVFSYLAGGLGIFITLTISAVNFYFEGFYLMFMAMLFFYMLFTIGVFKPRAAG
jgi:hypothetical protein